VLPERRGYRQHCGAFFDPLLLLLLLPLLLLRLGSLLHLLCCLLLLVMVLPHRVLCLAVGKELLKGKLLLLSRLEQRAWDLPLLLVVPLLLLLLLLVLLVLLLVPLGLRCWGPFAVQQQPQLQCLHHWVWLLLVCCGLLLLLLLLSESHGCWWLHLQRVWLQLACRALLSVYFALLSLLGLLLLWVLVPQL
jgi:hypothetical protein